MKKFFLLSVFALLSFSFARAQNEPFDVQMRVYQNALKNYDLQAASNALYNMIALKPERKDLNDSLALVYFAGERYGQAYIVGEQILKDNPGKNEILELVAVSKQSLGMAKEALADYEKLYAGEKSIYYLYQIATLQYQLKRYGECVASLDAVIADEKSATQKVSIQVQGGSQQVPMKAAALNVKGICALEMNQDDAAKENFNKALEIAPDFVLPKGNLELIKKKAEQKKAETKTTTNTTNKTTTTTPK